MILEGLRVSNRIGVLDAKLTAELERRNNNPSTTPEVSTTDSTSSNSSTVNDSNHSDPSEPINELFERSKNVPFSLKYFQSNERNLRQGVTKQLQKEFDDENQRLINLVHSNKKYDHDNLPRKLRSALKELKELTRQKVIDIRKVDKGNLILIIDFAHKD